MEVMAAAVEVAAVGAGADEVVVGGWLEVGMLEMAAAAAVDPERARAVAA